MNLIFGIATCFICGEQFDLGHHYEYHMSACINKRRVYKKMSSEVKRQIVERFELAMNEYLPGVLI